GAWLRGQVFLSFVIGFITWISLTVVGIEYALPLALLAGMLEVIPTLGPIIAAVPAVIVAFAVSPATAALVTVVYVIIQLAENNILVPKIMQKAVGLNPVAIIVAILIGGKVLGILGALLSIPFLSVLIIVYKQLRHLQ
ncbi:MAG: AI-2E family transporter, partial [Candidatus Levybacteria bacterium]|nr:AI-2E family transporter [Candidatus Levybacteria bacterium]